MPSSSLTIWHTSIQHYNILFSNFSKSAPISKPLSESRSQGPIHPRLYPMYNKRYKYYCYYNCQFSRFSGFGRAKKCYAVRAAPTTTVVPKVKGRRVAGESFFHLFFLSFILSFFLSFFIIIVILLSRESNVNVLHRGGVRVIHALAQFHEADNLDRGAIANNNIII